MPAGIMRQSERFYRDYTDSARWKSSRVTVETTDLLIRARSCSQARAENIVRRLRQEIRDHVRVQPDFLTSLSPVERTGCTPRIIELMYSASEKTGVGPMAAVAGAVAELVGAELAEDSEEVIVENGGDIWMTLTEPAKITLFSGSRYFDSALAISVSPEKTPCGVCTSSGRIGPSLSFGRADSATVISGDTALADAAATGAANMVQTSDDLTCALEWALGTPGVRGGVIVYRHEMAAQGDIELAKPF